MEPLKRHEFLFAKEFISLGFETDLRMKHFVVAFGPFAYVFRWGIK